MADVTASIPEKEALAALLHDSFVTAFFNIITADTPTSRVAYHKLLLIQIGAGFKQVHGQMSRVERALGPDLDCSVWDKPDKDSAHRFDYRCRLTQYLGNCNSVRRAELFLADNQDVLWMLVLGPSGAGKNRFALELALFASSLDWHAGFLADYKVNLATCPLCPKTLIIFDDLSANWATALDKLREASRRTGHKLRLLFLCRDESDPNVRAFRQALIDVNPRLERAPIRLAPFGTDDRRLIAKSFFELHGKDPDFDTWFGTLEQAVNSQPDLASPLWFSFASDSAARADHDHVLSWDRVSLAASVVHREWHRWETAFRESIESAAEVVFKATLLGQEIETGLPPGEARLLTEFSPTKSETAVGPLKPDPVGELFVLLRIQSDPLRNPSLTTGRDVIRKCDAAISDLWRSGETALAILGFRQRCLENFPDLIPRTALETVPNDAALPAAWSLIDSLVANLGHDSHEFDSSATALASLCRAGRIDTATGYRIALLVHQLSQGTAHQALLIMKVVEEAFHCGTVSPYSKAYYFSELGRLNVLTHEQRARCNRMAAQQYRQAIAQAPSFSPAKSGLADLLAELAKGAPGEDESISGASSSELSFQAMKFYRLAICDDPLNSFPRNGLAVLLTELAKELIPQDEKGRIRRQSDLNTEAAKLYREAIELNSSFAEPKLNLAILLTNLADGMPGMDAALGSCDPATLNTEAARLYRQAMKDDARSSAAKTGLAVLLAAMSKGAPGQDEELPGSGKEKLRTEAVRLLRQACEDDPLDSSPKSVLAVLLTEQYWQEPSQAKREEVLNAHLEIPRTASQAANRVWTSFALEETDSILNLLLTAEVQLEGSSSAPELEMEIYRFAYDGRPEAKTRAEELLNRGVHSPYWEFGPVIDWVKKHAPERLDAVTALAKVASEPLPPPVT